MRENQKTCESFRNIIRTTGVRSLPKSRLKMVLLFLLQYLYIVTSICLLKLILLPSRAPIRRPKYLTFADVC